MVNKQHIKQIAGSALISASITGSLFCLYHAGHAINVHVSNQATPSSTYCTADNPYPPVGGMCTNIGFVLGQYCNPGLDCPGLNGGANGGFPPQYPARR